MDSFVVAGVKGGRETTELPSPATRSFLHYYGTILDLIFPYWNSEEIINNV